MQKLRASGARSYPDPAASSMKLFLRAAAFVGVILGLIGAFNPARAAPHANAFYVAADGADTNPGTLAAPWRTIQHAADTLAPGDTVYVRGGIYHERVRITRSGANGNFITFAAYANETPVIDGTGIRVKSGWDPLVRIQDASYIRFEGFEIRNFKTRRVNRVPIGILIWGAGEYIEIRRNRVHDIKTNYRGVEGGDAHGIAAYGTRAPDSIRQLVIDGNELYALKLGSSEALVVNGNVEQFEITNNIVRDSNNIGIDAIGFEGVAPDEAYDQARDGVIADNLAYNIDSFTNPAYQGERSADCFYVDGGTRIVIERNIAHHCNIGVELASEHRGKATSYITLRNNFIYQNSEGGILIGGYDRRRGRAEHCEILNNTLYDNDTRAQGNGEVYLQYDTRYNVIRNNILYAGAQNLFIGSWSKKMTANVVNHNWYFTNGAGQWQWQKKMYHSFAAYQAATGNDAASTYGIDPAFQNLAAPDLHLQNNSPAIDRGENTSQAGATDLDGQTRIQGASIEIGADEVQ